MKILSFDEEARLLLYLRWGATQAVTDYLAPCPSKPSKKQWKSLRNVCMALLMLDCGLRVGEVVKLKDEHLYFQNQPVNMIYIPKYIAKRQHARELPVTSRIIESLKLFNFDCYFQGDMMRNEFVFANKMWGKPMTTRQVERIIGNAAMVSLGRVITPHMLRHTYATRLLKVTDTRTLQTLMGHKHLSSTQIYTHVGTDDRVMAVEAMQKRHLTSLGARSVPQ